MVHLLKTNSKKYRSRNKIAYYVAESNIAEVLFYGCFKLKLRGQIVMLLSDFPETSKYSEVIIHVAVDVKSPYNTSSVNT